MHSAELGLQGYRPFDCALGLHPGQSAGGSPHYLSNLPQKIPCDLTQNFDPLVYLLIGWRAEIHSERMTYRALVRGKGIAGNYCYLIPHRFGTERVHIALRGQGAPYKQTSLRLGQLNAVGKLNAQTVPHALVFRFVNTPQPL